MAKKLRLIHEVDWSGEEYPGQVKKAITTILKKQGYSPIKWQNRQLYNDILATNPKRGDFLPLLFKALNKELNNNGFELAFYELGDDAYYYFVLPIAKLAQISALDCEEFRIIDTRIYDIFILKQAKTSTKLTSLIKNKFKIPLAEIKQFLQQDKILFATGNLSVVKKYGEELESLGVIISIEERL